MRTSVRSRRPWRISSCPAACGIRCVKPSSATVSPSWTSAETASASEVSSAMGAQRTYVLGYHLSRQCSSIPEMTEAALPEPRRSRAPSVVNLAVGVASVLGQPRRCGSSCSRTDTISQHDLPAMTTTVQALWDMVQTRAFWSAFVHTVRGWALGLGLAIVARRPDRDRARLERLRRRGVPGADRVPPPDPLGGADPAALPHARDAAAQRGLPRQPSAPSGRCSSRRCTGSATSTRSRSTRRARSGSAGSSASGGSRCRARCRTS